MDGGSSDADAAAYAVVAHGVLTSASVIAGVAETLDQRWYDLDDERRRELVATMGAQARTIQTVLRSLVSAMPTEVFEPLREAIRGQIESAAVLAQPVDAAAAERRDAATEASPNTSID